MESGLSVRAAARVQAHARSRLSAGVGVADVSGANMVMTLEAQHATLQCGCGTGLQVNRLQEPNCEKGGDH